MRMPPMVCPKMLIMMNPRMIQTTERLTTPTQYLARLMRPSNDVKRYWKSIVSPSLGGQVQAAPVLVRPKGGFAKGGCASLGRQAVGDSSEIRDFKVLARFRCAARGRGRSAPRCAPRASRRLGLARRFAQGI